jgi:hypothetical protein
LFYNKQFRGLGFLKRKNTTLLDTNHINVEALPGRDRKEGKCILQVHEVPEIQCPYSQCRSMQIAGTNNGVRIKSSRQHEPEERQTTNIVHRTESITPRDNTNEKQTSESNTCMGRWVTFEGWLQSLHPSVEYRERNFSEAISKRRRNFVAMVLSLRRILFC